MNAAVVEPGLLIKKCMLSTSLPFPSAGKDAIPNSAAARNIRSRSLHPTIENWRDALRRVQDDATPDHWRRLRDDALRMGCPAPIWSSLYARTILQRGVFQTALLAVLEEPPSLRDAALAEIARAARASFTAPAPSPARPVGDFEHRLALHDAASSPHNAIELCIAFAAEYAAAAKPPAPEQADLALDAARTAARHSDIHSMITFFGRAAACAMRGAPVWDGWLREGPHEFQQACVVLVSCLDWLQIMQIAPLLGAEEQVRSLQALREHITDRYGEQRRSSAAASPSTPLPLDELLADVAALAGHGELPAEHPAHHDPDLRRRLTNSLLSLCHTRAEFDAFGADSGEYDDEQVDSMRAAMTQLEADCIVALGRLRSDGTEALHTLLHRAVDDDLHPAIGEAAVWALQQIGAPSLPMLRATVRFTSDSYARRQALLAFGGAARGDSDAYDELTALFCSTPWHRDRRDVAMPIALTADGRAANFLIDALGQSPPSTADVDALLDALTHLAVPWRWISEIQGIELPDGTRIPALPGLTLRPCR
jgi:hypothetical protein